MILILFCCFPGCIDWCRYFCCIFSLLWIYLIWVWGELSLALRSAKKCCNVHVILSNHLGWYEWMLFPLLPISTILVEPCCEARLTETGDVCVTLGSDRQCSLGTELNTVQLSIFSHRFMSIAGRPTEKMVGNTQRQKMYLRLICTLLVFVYRTDG